MLTMRSAPPSPGALESASQRQTTTGRVTSSWTPKPPSDGWPHVSLAPAKNTHSRQGSTSQCYRKPSRISSRRSGSAQRTEKYQGTRRPTNGTSSCRRSQTPAWSNGLAPWTNRGHARCRSSVPRAPQAGDREEGMSISLAVGCGQNSRKKYKMPESQRPNGAVAGIPKRLASRFYHLNIGHFLSGLYVYWTKNRPTAQCWWCRYQKQTRDHVFKVCSKWKGQQKILWAQVLKQSGRRRHRFTIWHLLAGKRCSWAVLDFLSTTDVGRLVPTEGDAGSQVFECELQERREWEEDRRP